jgi:hypothetical protein
VEILLDKIIATNRWHMLQKIIKVSLPCDSFDAFNVITKAISIFALVAQAVALSTGNAILSYILSLSLVKA